MPETLATPALWIGFGAPVLLFLAHRFGSKPGMEFLAGYLIEKALSIDNLFVFLIIFSSFSVPPAYQHRILFWGILGAFVLRGIFIFGGTALIHSFHWLLYVFAAFLILTGIKLFVKRTVEIHPDRNIILRLFRRMVPTLPGYTGPRFFTRQDGRWYATPLLPVLVLVETSDLIFAVDSIPAIFLITTDPFLVYTSNIFAILGLRSLYFAVAGLTEKFRYLKVGLAILLIFIGAKMFFGEVYELPIGLSLGVIALILTVSILASLLHPEKGPDPPGSGSC